MVQNPTWADKFSAASQEIPRVLWNPKVHYLTHKPPPTVPIQGQANPVQKTTLNFLEIHPNFIHPSTPRCPQWPLSLRFPHQDPMNPLSSPIPSTCPAYPIPLYIIPSRVNKLTANDLSLQPLNHVIPIHQQCCTNIHSALTNTVTQCCLETV